jgi:hypothetical protein
VSGTFLSHGQSCYQGHKFCPSTNKGDSQQSNIDVKIGKIPKKGRFQTRLQDHPVHPVHAALLHIFCPSTNKGDSQTPNIDVKLGKIRKKVKKSAKKLFRH